MWLRYSVLRPIALILAGSKNYGLQYTGADYAPSRGPFIVVANHQTGVDPIAVALALHKTLKSTPMIPWGKVFPEGSRYRTARGPFQFGLAAARQMCY